MLWNLTKKHGYAEQHLPHKTYYQDPHPATYYPGKNKTKIRLSWNVLKSSDQPPKKTITVTLKSAEPTDDSSWVTRESTQQHFRKMCTVTKITLYLYS